MRQWHTAAVFLSYHLFLDEWPLHLVTELWVPWGAGHMRHLAHGPETRDSVEMSEQCTAECSAQEYSALQCTGVQCSAVHRVQCSAVHRSTVQCSAQEYSALQCTGVQCSAVHRSTVQCTVVLLDAMQGPSAVQDRYAMAKTCSAAQYSAMQDTTVLCSAIQLIQCSIMQCSTI